MYFCCFCFCFYFIFPRHLTFLDAPDSSACLLSLAFPFPGIVLKTSYWLPHGESSCIWPVQQILSSSDLRTPCGLWTPFFPCCQPCFATVLNSLCFGHVFHNCLDLQASPTTNALGNSSASASGIHPTLSMRKIADVSGRDKLQELSFHLCFLSRKKHLILCS